MYIYVFEFLYVLSYYLIIYKLLENLFRKICVNKDVCFILICVLNECWNIYIYGIRIVFEFVILIILKVSL